MNGDGAHTAPPTFPSDGPVVISRSELRTLIEDATRQAAREATQQVLAEYKGLKPLLTLKDLENTIGKKRDWIRQHGPQPLVLGTELRWHPDTVAAWLKQQEKNKRRRRRIVRK